MSSGLGAPSWQRRPAAAAPGAARPPRAAQHVGSCRASDGMSIRCHDGFAVESEFAHWSKLTGAETAAQEPGRLVPLLRLGCGWRSGCARRGAPQFCGSALDSRRVDSRRRRSRARTLRVAGSARRVRGPRHLEPARGRARSWCAPTLSGLSLAHRGAEARDPAQIRAARRTCSCAATRAAARHSRSGCRPILHMLQAQGRVSRTDGRSALSLLSPTRELCLLITQVLERAAPCLAVSLPARR